MSPAAANHHFRFTFIPLPFRKPKSDRHPRPGGLGPFPCSKSGLVLAAAPRAARLGQQAEGVAFGGFPCTGHNVLMGRVILGVTGGVAGYKACEVTRPLVRARHQGAPLLTPDAQRLLAAQTFEALGPGAMPR